MIKNRRVYRYLSMFLEVEKYERVPVMLAGVLPAAANSCLGIMKFQFLATACFDGNCTLCLLCVVTSYSNCQVMWFLLLVAILPDQTKLSYNALLSEDINFESMLTEIFKIVLSFSV